MQAGDPIQILSLTRGKGPAYTLGPPFQPWSWLKMFRAMPPTTLELLVGPGIVELVLMPLDDSYDHKRRSAARDAGHPFPQDAPVPVWDFAVVRADGSWMRFHPNQTKKKIDIADMTSFDYERSGPQRGKGLSDGKGTFRRMLEGTYNMEGQFKKARSEEMPPSSVVTEGASAAAGAAAPVPRPPGPQTASLDPSAVAEVPGESIDGWVHLPDAAASSAGPSGMATPPPPPDCPSRSEEGATSRQATITRGCGDNRPAAGQAAPPPPPPPMHTAPPMHAFPPPPPPPLRPKDGSS